MIRDATKEDCINLTALSLQVWLDTYAVDGIDRNISGFVLSLFTPAYFEERLDSPDYRMLVFTEGAYLRGYVLVNLTSRHQGEENGFEIDKLYVQGPFQGRGIGRRLLEAAASRYGRRFWLYTWVRNRAIGFYKHFGFRDIGRYDFQVGDISVENRVLAYSP